MRGGVKKGKTAETGPVLLHSVSEDTGLTVLATLELFYVGDRGVRTVMSNLAIDKH